MPIEAQLLTFMVTETVLEFLNGMDVYFQNVSKLYMHSKTYQNITKSTNGHFTKYHTDKSAV